LVACVAAGKRVALNVVGDGVCHGTAL
jgi:hypothetical protein